MSIALKKLSSHNRLTKTNQILLYLDLIDKIKAKKTLNTNIQSFKFYWL